MEGTVPWIGSPGTTRAKTLVKAVWPHGVPGLITLEQGAGTCSPPSGWVGRCIVAFRSLKFQTNQQNIVCLLLLALPVYACLVYQVQLGIYTVAARFQ